MNSQSHIRGHSLRSTTATVYNCLGSRIPQVFVVTPLPTMTSSSGESPLKLLALGNVSINTLSSMELLMVDLYRWRWYSGTFRAAHSQRPHAQGDGPEERETEEEWSTAPCLSSKAMRSLRLNRWYWYRRVCFVFQI